MGVVLGFSIVMLIITSEPPKKVKMDHAIAAQYMCSRVDGDVKEFIAVPSKKGNVLTAWCKNGVTLTIEIPDEKQPTKDV